MPEITAITYKDGSTWVNIDGICGVYLDQEELKRALSQLDTAVMVHDKSTPDNDPRADKHNVCTCGGDKGGHSSSHQASSV